MKEKWIGNDEMSGGEEREEEWGLLGRVGGCGFADVEMVVRRRKGYGRCMGDRGGEFNGEKGWGSYDGRVGIKRLAVNTKGSCIQ